MEEYINLLKTFKIVFEDDQPIRSNSYVDLDCIHEAILIEGLNFEKPLNYYIIKAKQVAINEYAKQMRRKKIIDDNIETLFKLYNLDTIEEYGFNDNELDYIARKMAGIPDYKSGLPRHKIRELKKEIKRKIKLYI